MAQEEQVIIPIPSGGGVPMPGRSDRADLVDKISPAAVVELARHLLQGEDWNGSKWIKVPALQEESLTEIGAWKIAAELQGIANVSTMTSKYKEETIKARLQRLTENVQIQLVGHWTAYGVKNKAMFYSVHNLIFSICMAVLFQAGEGSIQDLLGKIKSENTNINTDKKEPGKLRRVLGL